MPKLCLEDGCTAPVHARRRCFEHWVALGVAECRAIAVPRRKAKAEEHERALVREARKARLAGDRARRAFILRERRLPEELPAQRKGQKTFRGQSIDRTFVSDITLDAGETDWQGYDYFGDVQFADWPEREKLGVGGRDTSRLKKR